MLFCRPSAGLNEELGYEMELSNIEVDEWEISPERISLREVIGSGAFGAVWRATLIKAEGNPGNQIVAAKCFARENPCLQFT